jgi:hypothetical protein
MSKNCRVDSSAIRAGQLRNMRFRFPAAPLRRRWSEPQALASFFFPVVQREGVELRTGRRGESPPARRMCRREAVADAAIEPERAAGPAVRADVADDRLRYRFHAGEVRQLHRGPGRSRGASTIGGDIGRRRSLGTQRAKAPACRVNGWRRAAKATAKVNLRSSSKRITATPLACLAKRNNHSHNISE